LRQGLTLLLRLGLNLWSSCLNFLSRYYKHASLCLAKCEFSKSSLGKKFTNHCFLCIRFLFFSSMHITHHCNFPFGIVLVPVWTLLCGRFWGGGWQPGRNWW
jgi:hypothetical protein